MERNPFLAPDDSPQGDAVARFGFFISRRSVITYGAIAGLVTVAAIAVTVAHASSARVGAVGSSGAEWIAYQRVGAVMLVRPDGSGDHVLTATPKGDQEHPDWSPDGKHIAMDVDFAGIWVVDTDGKHPQQVVSCRKPCYFVQDGAWSPDGKTIAYVRADLDASGRLTARSRILRLDLASGAARTVATFTTGMDAAFSPRWSPDGRRLVFELDRFVDAKASTTTITGSRIGTVRADGTGGLRFLTPFTAIAAAPDWNPRRNVIVYQAGSRGIPDYPNEPANLFTINPDGTGKRQLTHFTPPTKRAVQPTWTPDGNQVIFTYVRGTGFGHPVAAFIRSDGSNLKAPPPGSRIQTHPRQQP